MQIAKRKDEFFRKVMCRCWVNEEGSANRTEKERLLGWEETLKRMGYPRLQVKTVL